MIYTSKTYAAKSVNLDLNPFLLQHGIGLLIHQLRYFLILNPLLESLMHRKSSFYLMGDLNCNTASPQPDINTVLLTNIVDIYNLLSSLEYVKETEHRFEFKTTNCLTDFSLLSKLCKSKVMGLDTILARHLQECADLQCSSDTSKLRIRVISQGFIHFTPLLLPWY